jgi:hypothetical protein
MASKDTGEIVEMNDGHREPLQRKHTDAYDRNADPGPGYITGELFHFCLSICVSA